jgi:hypothetical protein
MKKYSINKDSIVIDFPAREQQAAVLRYRLFELLVISTITILIINKIIVI